MQTTRKQDTATSANRRTNGFFMGLGETCIRKRYTFHGQNHKVTLSGAFGGFGQIGLRVSEIVSAA